jgi:hypothetical protein
MMLFPVNRHEGDVREVSGDDVRTWRALEEKPVTNNGRENSMAQLLDLSSTLGSYHVGRSVENFTRSLTLV